MGFLSRFFGRKDAASAPSDAVVSAVAAPVEAAVPSDEAQRVGRVNPEYRRVSLIAASIAAGDRPESALSCVRIRRRVASGEENHAS